jgi:hypothetical protein
MPVTRTIYTQGAINIYSAANNIFGGNSIASGSSGTSGTPVGLYLSGVQSVNFSANSPQQDVNSFGVLGSINKVQVEPATATLEVNLVINSGNSAGTDPGWLSGLVRNSQLANPSGVVITASGIGQVSGAVLSSFRIEASVGNLPTLALTFEGVSGAPQTAGGAPNTPNAQTVVVVTPDVFGTLYWNGVTSGCPQTVRASWEMPVERLNCLGSPINTPTIFSRPPGSMSFVAEGIDAGMLTSTTFLTGVQIGPFKLAQNSGSIKETSRTANMAVGDAAATFNITSEGVALGATVTG